MKLPILLLGLVVTGAAHDLTVRVEQVAPSVILYSTYAGADPVTDADIAIYSPDNADSPYQTGLTDIQGVFAFVPSGLGEWRAVVDDGFGHRTERTISIDWQADASQESTAPQTTWSKAVTGVAVIFGCTGILLWLRTRSSGERA